MQPGPVPLVVRPGNKKKKGTFMRKLVLGLAMVATALPIAAIPSAADARSQYREWRGRDGRVYCRRSNGTTGLIVGGAAGALAGRAIDTRGDRTVGTLVGAGAGALLGREIDRGGKRRCR